MASRRTEIIQACAFGAVGLASVGFAIHDLVLQRPLAYEFSLGLLMLVMAHQLVAGVSKEARLWVDRAFALVLIGGLVPPFVRAAVASALTRSILAATALVVLLLAAVWVLRRARRRSSPS